MDIQTLWNTDGGFGDWALDPTQITAWVDQYGASITDGAGNPIDVVVTPGAGLKQQGDLITAVLISLFTDAAASADDALPDGSSNPRGWWGGPIGSKLWLRQREKQTPTVLELVRNDIDQALAWLVTDGIAAAIDVVTEFTRPGMLGAMVTIHRDSSPAVSLRFNRLWDML